MAASDAEHRIENVRDRRLADAVGVGTEIPGQVLLEPLHYYIYYILHQFIAK